MLWKISGELPDNSQSYNCMVKAFMDFLRSEGPNIDTMALFLFQP